MILYRTYLWLALVVCYTGSIKAQESNLTRYTPAILLDSDQWEVNLFNNLYTQNEIRDREGEKISIGQRQTFINGTYQFTYGLSGRLNIGVDINLNRAYYGDESSSVLEVFSSDGSFSRTVVSSVGPRLKWVPFLDLTNFSIQSTILIPVAKDLEVPQFTAHDRYTWFTQFFYDQEISSKWRAFFEADILYRFKRQDTQVNFFRTPLSAFLSYFPTSKYTVYIFGQYAPRFQKVSNIVDEQFGLSSWFTQIGVGAKHQLSSHIGLELSYGKFIASRQDGAGSAVNFGLRYIRK